MDRGEGAPGESRDRVRGPPAGPRRTRVRSFGLDRRVRPRAHRQTQIGDGERGRVVDAVPDHGDRTALGPQPFHHGDLVLGQHLGDHLVDADRSGDRPRRRRLLSPVSNTVGGPACAARPPPRRWSPSPRPPRRRPRAPRRPQPTTTAVRPSLSASSLAWVTLGRESVVEAPHGHLAALHACVYAPRPGTFSEVLGVRRAPTRSSAPAAIGAGHGVLGGVLDGAREPQHLRLSRCPLGGVHVVRGRAAGGDGAGLVEDDRVDAPPRGLEHFRSLDEDAELGAAPVPTISAVGVAGSPVRTGRR